MKSARVSLPLSTMALLAAAILPAVGRGEERPVNIAMGDQFNNRVETAQLRGDVVVLVYAGRHGAEAAMELGRTLHTRFHPTAEGAEPKAWSTQPVVGLAGWPAGLPVPDVKVIPVACVPEVPKALHGMVRRRLKQESPVVPVWLDFEDVMRPSFGMVPDEPNVLLIDDLRKQALPHVRTASFPAPVRQ